MKVRKILYADEGKILTDGENYGTQIFLADGADEAAYYEISQEAYDIIMAEEEARMKQMLGE